MRIKGEQAVTVTVFYSVALIALFYCKSQLAPEMDQNQYRLSVLVFFSLFSFCLLYYYDSFKPYYLFDCSLSSFQLLISVVVLFAGPLVQLVFKKMSFPSKRRILSKFDAEFRKAVIYAPILEEIIYRGAYCNLWLNAGLTKKQTIFISPTIFGLSHFHKFFASINLPRQERNRNLLTSAFQCVYTTVFGWFSAYAWVKTHSIITCILLHSFCNFMQVPDFVGALKWRVKWQRILIQLAYVIGVIGFSLIISTMGI